MLHARNYEISVHNNSVSFPEELNSIVPDMHARPLLHIYSIARNITGQSMDVAIHVGGSRLAN